MSRVKVWPWVAALVVWWAIVWAIVLLWPDKPVPQRGKAHGVAVLPAPGETEPPLPVWDGSKWTCDQGWQVVARQQPIDQEMPDVACAR